jgi:hypothetical protein
MSFLSFNFHLGASGNLMKKLIYISLFISSLCIAEPEWIFNPDKAGYPLSIVGSAFPQKMGDRAQYKQAELSARREFSANKSIYVKSIQKEYTDSDNNSHFESNSYLNSSGLIDFSSLEKVKEWKDPKTGELFLLFALTH